MEKENEECDLQHSRQTQQGKDTFSLQHAQEIGSGSIGVRRSSKVFSVAAFLEPFPFTIFRVPRPTILSFFAFSRSLNIFLHRSEVSLAAEIRLLASYECTRFRERSKVCEGKCANFWEASRRTPSGLSKQFWQRSMLVLRSSNMHMMHWYRQNAMSLVHRSQYSRPLSHTPSS